MVTFAKKGGQKNLHDDKIRSTLSKQISFETNNSKAFKIRKRSNYEIIYKNTFYLYYESNEVKNQVCFDWTFSDDQFHVNIVR